MRVEYLFWVSLVICAISFLLFLFQCIAQVIIRPKHVGGADAAVPQGLDPADMLEKVGEVVQAFGKAGPLATSAVLCVFFSLMSLITSGAIKVDLQ